MLRKRRWYRIDLDLLHLLQGGGVEGVRGGEGGRGGGTGRGAQGGWGKGGGAVGGMGLRGGGERLACSTISSSISSPLGSVTDLRGERCLCGRTSDT